MNTEEDTIKIMRARTSTAQKLPRDFVDKISTFTQYVRELRVETDVPHK